MSVEWAEIWPKIDSVYGWLSEVEAKRLFDLTSNPEGVDEPVVELGAFMGRSTAALAYGLLERGSDSLVISVDTWIGTKGADEESLHENIMRGHGVTDMFELHRKNMKALNLDPWTRRIRGTTAAYGSEWAREWDVFPRVLFIDADHRYEGVSADFRAWAPLVIVGGYAAFHDSWAPGPSRVIAEMPENFVRLDDSGDLAVFRKVG
jgi:hypothetical protein